MELSDNLQKAIKQIAKDENITYEEAEQVVSLSLYVLENVFRRGMNIDLGLIKFEVSKEMRGILKKQRIGDQYEIKQCIRFQEKINTKRQQTFYKVQNLKNNK